MSRYVVRSSLGDKWFAREEDATDYQIKILTQTGIRSDLIDTYDVCEKCRTRCGAEKPYGTDCKL